MWFLSFKSEKIIYDTSKPLIIPEFDAGEAVASVFILLDGGWASDILSPSEKYYEIIVLNYNIFRRSCKL